MSALEDFLLGESGTPARVVDATPTRFQQMRIPTADRITSIIDPARQGGLPAFANPRDPSAFTADPTQRERDILNALQETARGSPQFNAARQGLGEMIQTGGGTNRFAEAINPFTRGEMGGDFMRRLLSGETLRPESNPFLQETIEAAQRPVIDRFEGEIARTEQDFTQAGQQVQGQASSPFEEARRNLQSDLAAQLGDIGTRIASENFQQERDRMLQAALRGGQQFEFARQSRVPAAESTAERQFEAIQAAPGFEQAQIEGLNQVLEAQALPRLIEQQGRQQGLEEFRRQQRTLLEVLRMATQATAGQPAQMPGTEGSPGFLGTALSAAGAAFGGPFGAAAGQGAGDLISGALRDDPSGPLGMGNMGGIGGTPIPTTG